MWACGYNSNIDVIKYLLEIGFSFSFTNKKQMTGFMLACVFIRTLMNIQIFDRHWNR